MVQLKAEKQWTPEMDAALRAQKEAGKQWRAINVPAMTQTDCRKRWDALRAVEASDRIIAAAPKSVVVEREPEVHERDGLLWLVVKRRMTVTRLRAAHWYRQLYRVAMTEDGALKSCLEVGVGGGETKGMPGAAPVTLLAAKRALFVIRHQVLGGQVDMLTVMDGVCGSGRTLRELATGDKVGAAGLEAVLRVALDLVYADMVKGAQKAA